MVNALADRARYNALHTVSVGSQAQFEKRSSSFIFATQPLFMVTPNVLFADAPQRSDMMPGSYFPSSAWSFRDVLLSTVCPFGLAAVPPAEGGRFGSAWARSPAAGRSGGMSSLTKRRALSWKKDSVLCSWGGRRGRC